MQALSFTDEQLSALMRAATPIPPADRSAFLEAVAAKLDCKVLGDGVVFRTIRDVQARYLSPSERLAPGPRAEHANARFNLSILTK
jgi:hypothetical protein